MKRILDNLLAAFGILALFTIIGGTAHALATYKPTTCTAEPIHFEKQEVRDESLETGKTALQPAGQDGQTRVCRKDGKEVSRAVTASPVTEVAHIGTKAPAPPPAPTVINETPAQLSTPDYTPRYRTGAVCNDGSYSSATGRGACSWHDGVDYWLYE